MYHRSYPDRFEVLVIQLREVWERKLLCSEDLLVLHQSELLEHLQHLLVCL